jgi:hypothetical protein
MVRIIGNLNTTDGGHSRRLLVQQGYLLAEDRPTVTAQAAQCYDLFQGRVRV